jgi:hypothetical protein
MKSVDISATDIKKNKMFADGGQIFHGPKNMAEMS